MPFYLRKAISLGPFRFNLSKSGIGISAGVPGFRVGTGPRGHYVHAGMGGVYYRSSIGGKRRQGTRQPQAEPMSSPSIEPQPIVPSDGIILTAIDSADVAQMQPSDLRRILDEISRARRRWPLTIVLPALAVLLALWFRNGGVGPEWMVIAAPVAALMLGYFIDLRRRNRLLMYSFDEAAAGRYQLLCDAWDEAAKSHRIWHLDSAGRVEGAHARKRNSGARTVVVRQPTRLDYGLPARLKCNLKPPKVRVGRQVLYLMPDVVIVEEGRRLGGVSYKELSVRSERTGFVEEDPVPRDAEVAHTVWKYANRDGAPDRRFSNNRQLPVCIYDQLLLRSDSGLTEILQFSRVGLADALRDALARQASM